MTIGSAASLRGPVPRTPLPSFRSFGPASGPASPPRLALAQLDDPPLGRILVVEDDAVIALDLQRLLRDAGYRVIGPAASVAEAETLLARPPIDGAVLDLGNDGRTALAVADRLTRRRIPCVFVAGPDGPALPQEHADAPVVVEPYTAEELLAAVRRALAEDDEASTGIRYPTAPAQVSWPRVFPQL